MSHGAMSHERVTGQPGGPAAQDATGHGARPAQASVRRTRGGLLVVSAVCGIALGFAVSRLGFGDYSELNRMFTFRDPRLFGAFGGGVALALAASLVIFGRPASQSPVHRGVVPGAILFGIGWAISGGCPAIPIIQLAQGYLPALVTIAGIVTGMRLSHWFTRRYFPVDHGTCG